MGRLRDQVLRIGARELEDWRALDLLFDQHGDLSGLTVLDTRTGVAAVLLARVVVVATGGSATMYRIAAPAREKTGDGMAMCWRAGLEFRDMEMLQFHPTGLVAGTSALTGAVLEEGLRGAGARLTNALGERFMERADPVRLERSTRDVVARASYVEILEGRGTPAGGVLLDVSHLGAAEVERRFGEMAARTRLDRCRPRHRAGRGLADSPLPHGRRHHRSGLHHVRARPPRRRRGCRRHPRREPARREWRRRVDRVRRARRGCGRGDRAGEGHLHARSEAGRRVGRASVRAAEPDRRTRAVRAHGWAQGGDVGALRPRSNTHRAPPGARAPRRSSKRGRRGSP